MLAPVVRVVVVVVPWEAGMGLAGPRPSKAEANSARWALPTKEALVVVDAVEIRCRQKSENQVVDQVDARRG